MDQDTRELVFVFLCRDQADVDALFTKICSIVQYIWEGFCVLILGSTYSQGVVATILEPQELLSSLPISFLCLDRGKMSSRALLAVWEEWKMHSKQPKCSFSVQNYNIAVRSTAKSSKRVWLGLGLALALAMSNICFSLALLEKPLYPGWHLLFLWKLTRVQK